MARDQKDEGPFGCPGIGSYQDDYIAPGVRRKDYSDRDDGLEEYADLMYPDDEETDEPGENPNG